MQLKRRNTLNEVKDMSTGIPSSDECLSVWKAPGDVFKIGKKKDQTIKVEIEIEETSTLNL